MRLRIIGLFAISAALVTGGGYYYLYAKPEAVLQRTVQKKLDELSVAVASQSPDKVRTVLEGILHDPSEIRLAVYFPIPGQKRQPKTPDSFGKPEFLGLIDNTLYTVNNYSFRATAGVTTIASDNASATVDFIAESRAHGTSSLLMEANAQFVLPANCRATLLLAPQPSLNALTCDVEILRGSTK